MHFFLLDYLMTLFSSYSIASNGGMLMNAEFERRKKEAAMACLKVLFNFSLGGTGDNYEHPNQDCWHRIRYVPNKSDYLTLASSRPHT
jgi:hypothetical protein